MKEDISRRLSLLRIEMAKSGVDAVIIPQTDPHQSEYIAPHWQVRRFLSGFTGSAGTLVVTATKALLWADSRYFIQAEAQLSGTEIELMKDGLPATPSIETYLIGELEEGQTVGIDGMLFSATAAADLAAAFASHGIKLVTNFDAIDKVWTDRPRLPRDPVKIHPAEFNGMSANSKLARIRALIAQKGGHAAFVTPLDEIAWTLNLRGNDVKYNPVFTAFLYVHPVGATLFIDNEKISNDVADYLKANRVEVKPYAAVKEFLASVSERKVLVQKSRTAVALTDILGEKAVDTDSIIAVMKAVRNETEMNCIRTAMVRDGVAMCETLYEIEAGLAAGKTLTELDVDAMLHKHRSEKELYVEESFGSIVGYGPHGAIVHYEPTKESNVALAPSGLLLIDSGAQYQDGTTDITRTICLGTPTDSEKRDYTLVLKGHIALATAVFPEGTRGAQLDVLARQFLWREGLGYLHGTGHGVGHYLNVHEGPQSIRLNYTPTPLMPGMLTSNEPGLYREGVHGIRIENLVLTVPAMTTEFGSFLKFETVTLCPIDTTLVDRSIFTEEERLWLNAYHAKVYDLLSTHLTEPLKAWLADKTQPIF